MVIDKTGILSILRSSEDDLKNHPNEDSILITTSCDDFSLSQIGSDSIDLRIAQKGYIILNNYEYINTLSEEDFGKYFQEITLRDDKGYDLKPGEILFIGTLERIHLAGDLIGRVSGRSTFSRFGLSVHCTQDKFSSGINSIAALQIKNNSNTVLKIFPYQKLAQLIIEKTNHNEHPYSGTFSLETEYKLPVIKPSDREQYDSRSEQCILRLKPKKKPFFERHSKSTKLNSLVQSIFGFIISVGFGIFGFMSDKKWAIGIMIFLSVIYIMMSWFFYKISTKFEGDN
mgnify:CR=1 FL=1